MGWNEVAWTRPHPVTAGIPDRTRFYFVHSYYVCPDDDALTLGRCEYIAPFTAAIASGYVIATQFHPEKSAQAGLSLLRNFLAWDGGPG
jgi:glutamine amidotransferase